MAENALQLTPDYRATAAALDYLLSHPDLGIIPGLALDKLRSVFGARTTYELDVLEGEDKPDHRLYLFICSDEDGKVLRRLLRKFIRQWLCGERDPKLAHLGFSLRYQ